MFDTRYTVVVEVRSRNLKPWHKLKTHDHPHILRITQLVGSMSAMGMFRQLTRTATFPPPLALS